MKIGEQIKEMRKVRGWSQGELATRSKMAQSRVCCIEKSSNATIKTLRKLAIALDCDLAINLSLRESKSNGARAMDGLVASVTGIQQREQETKLAMLTIKRKLQAASSTARRLLAVLDED